MLIPVTHYLLQILPALGYQNDSQLDCWDLAHGSRGREQSGGRSEEIQENLEMGEGGEKGKGRKAERREEAQKKEVEGEQSNLLL